MRFKKSDCGGDDWSIARLPKRGAGLGGKYDRQEMKEWGSTPKGVLRRRERVDILTDQ